MGGNGDYVGKNEPLFWGHWGSITARILRVEARGVYNTFYQWDRTVYRCLLRSGCHYVVIMLLFVINVNVDRVVCM